MQSRECLVECCCPDLTAAPLIVQDHQDHWFAVGQLTISFCLLHPCMGIEAAFKQFMDQSFVARCGVLG